VMSIALMPGSRLPAYCTSMGRVMLAALPEAEMQARLERSSRTARTALTLTGMAELMAEIARVRSQGFSIIDQEIEMGLCSIAVPLRNARGQVIAALNLGRAAGPEPMADVAPRLLPELTKVAADLRALLR
ncbi:MAG: IclR family transcriptional regulator, partial [Rhodobacteraceae bacterium]|nr:IclR family transcriptional regulator [Paracoccaceae bacterium]